MTLEASFEDFDVSIFRARFALLVGVAAHRVRVNVAPGSVIVISTVETEDASELNTISTTLRALDRSSASTALQLDVESIDVAASVEQVQPLSPPSTSPPSPDSSANQDGSSSSSGKVVGVIVGAVAGTVLLILLSVALWLCLRRREKRKSPRTVGRASTARRTYPPVVEGIPIYAQITRSGGKADQPAYLQRPTEGCSSDSGKPTDPQGQELSFS